MTETDTVTGLTWTVRLVRKGDRFGLDLRLVHEDDDPMVEFYDCRYPEPWNDHPWGQFASSYYLSTLEKHPVDAGINLHNGVPDWSVSAEFVSVVMNWLTSA